MLAGKEYSHPDNAGGAAKTVLLALGLKAEHHPENPHGVAIKIPSAKDQPLYIHESQAVLDAAVQHVKAGDTLVLYHVEKVSTLTHTGDDKEHDIFETKQRLQAVAEVVKKEMAPEIAAAVTFEFGASVVPHVSAGIVHGAKEHNASTIIIHGTGWFKGHGRVLEELLEISPVDVVEVRDTGKCVRWTHRESSQKGGILPPLI